jgi:hypothetical protein
MSDFSVNLFYSYCHADENHRKEMEKYLTLLRKEGILKEWCDRKILPGQKITEVIHQQLSKAEIIVFLVSIDFLNSAACQEEWELAKSLAKVSNKSLISIILRECPWLEFDDMGDYLALPTDGKSVSSFADKDAAWNNVYSGIKAVVENIRSNFELKDEFINKISLLEFCSQTNEAFTLNDLFVFPNLIKPSDSIEDELQLRNSNDILNEKKIIIQGDNQSGKTKLCSHVFLDLITNNSPALLVDLNNIASKKPSIEVIRQCYSEQYKGDFDLWVSQTDKTIIFDNLSHFGNSIEHILLAEPLFDTVIIMTSIDDYESYFKDDIRLLHYSFATIKPFTHVKQEKLIKKWLQFKRRSIVDDVQDGEIDQIENNINSVIIDNKILPRYPFFILSILQTYEAFMPQDLKITAYGHCYYALILAHLIKSGVAKDDNSISQCFNYANHLAYEMQTKIQDLSFINYEDYELFKNKYTERFIIKDSLLNRLHGIIGIIKEVNGRGYKFSLAYSYYYFLGQFLAKNYKSNKAIVNEMIEKSYKKNNSLSLIFTIHHAQDLEIIDEILTHTICAIDKIEPAKLDKSETQIFQELLAVIPKRIISDQSVDKERDRERALRDKVESKSDVSAIEDESDHDFLNQIYQCHKNIEILSQILKNKFGSLEKTKITEIVEIICDAGLRLSKIFHSEDMRVEELIDYIQKQYITSDKFDANKPVDEQLTDIRRIVIFRIFIWVMSNLERTVASINKPEIHEIIENLRLKKNTPAYDLIHYFYTLDTAKDFDEDKKGILRDLLKKHDEKSMFFLHRILSIRTQHYLNTHTIKAPMKQAVSSLLKIEYKP